MCLTAIAINHHPEFPFVLISNREEFHKRPTAPADFWDSHPHILGGRDLQAGGTWLGITRQGRIANITNYRDFRLPGKTDPPSRGKLVVDLLHPEANEEAYLKKINEDADLFPGFSLLAGTTADIWFYSNIEKQIKKVPDGISGLSNQLLNTPWPKVSAAIAALESWSLKGEVSFDPLFETLADRNKYEDPLLPDTGIGIEFERKVSSIFILDPTYGTRASTVIAVDKKGLVSFAEKTFDANGNHISTEEHRFQIQVN